METKDLITAYAYSNLQRAILTTILADTIRASNDPAEMLQQYYGSTREHLQRAEFPPGDENSEPVSFTASPQLCPSPVALTFSPSVSSKRLAFPPYRRASTSVTSVDVC